MEITAIVVANALFAALAVAAAFLGGRAYGLVREDAEETQSVARRVAELSALVERSLERLEALADVETAAEEAGSRALDLSAALSALMSYGEGKS